MHYFYLQETDLFLLGEDVILLAGSTGSGKSTTANYLIGEELVVTKIQEKIYLQGIGYRNYEQAVIDSKGQFTIGHSKVSQTQNLQVSGVKGSCLICDSPGFFDNRGTEMEIANATILDNFLKNCKSVRLVVLISYSELVAMRGALFKDMCDLIKRIVRERQSFQKILFLFTKLGNKTIDSIRNEVLQIYQSISADSEYNSEIMRNLIEVILDQLEENNTIVTPTDGKHDILLERILRQTPFSNPSEEFSFSVSEPSNQRIYVYTEETQNNIAKLKDKGHFQEVMQILYDFKQLRDYTGNQILRDTYTIFEDSFSREVMKKVETIIFTFTEASVKSNIFSEQNIKDIIQIQSCLKIIDGRKNEVFEYYDFSEDQFIKQIEQVCFNICKQITEDFPANIPNVKINLSKIKDFAEQTGLGVEKYSEKLRELNQIYSKEVNEFKGASESFYLRDVSFNEKELQKKIDYFAKKLELIKQIDEFLSQFIACEGEDSFYANISKYFYSKNNQLLDIVVSTIEQIDKNLLSSNPIDESQRAVNIQKETLPSFEITLLRLLSENRKYAEYITGSEENYTKALRYLKEFSAKIFHFVKENYEENPHLKLGNVLKMLDDIRNFNEQIQNQTAEEYCQFIDEIRKKIKDKANQGKKLISIYSEEIDENEGTLEKQEVISFKQQQKKDFKKIQKIYEFLTNIQWTDEFFQTKFTQRTLEKLMKEVDSYFEQCCKKIQSLANNERFDQLRFFITILVNLKDLEGLITNYKDNYEQNIQLVKSKVMEKINSINNFVNDLHPETNFVTNNEWKTLSEDLAVLKQIQQLEQSLDVMKSKDSIDQITNFIQKYYSESFEKIKKIRGMTSSLMINEKLHISKTLTDFLNNAKLISIQFQELEILAGEEYSFKKLTSLIKTTYDSLEDEYVSKKQENGDLQEIQSSYNNLNEFVQQIDFDFLHETFKNVTTPKQTISETFKIFSSSIRSGNYQNLHEYLEQLKNLRSDKDKQQLSTEFERLKKQFEFEIFTISITIKQTQKKQIDSDLLESFKLNLNNLASIKEILLNYRKELFQETLQTQLSKLLKEIEEEFLMKSKQQLLVLIYKFDFKQMELNYGQLVQFINKLDRYKTIFDENEWNIHIKLIVATTKKEIEQTILSLHSQQDNLDSLQQLITALNEAENMHSDFYQHYEDEKKLTIKEMQSKSDNLVESIYQKIQRQDTRGLINARKIFQSFIRKIVGMETTELHEFQYDLECYSDKIEDLIDEDSNQRQKDIGELIANQKFIEAAKQLKSIKQVNDSSYAQIVNQMKEVITTSFTQIKEAYPSMEPSHFSSILKRALNHLKMRKQFGSDAENFDLMANEFINYLFSKSERLLNESEQILSQRESAFTKEHILKLLNQFKYFQIIKPEFGETQRLKDLLSKLDEVFRNLNQGLRKLLESQQELLSQEMKVQNLKPMCRKFEALLQIVKSDATLFTGFQILIELKQICDKLFTQDTLIQKLKRKFDASEQALYVALTNYDFSRVVQSFNNLKKSISISQEFQHNFVDLTSLCKKIESTINIKTQEAVSIIQMNILYDEKLNELVDQIYRADQHLINLKEIQISPQMDILNQQLNEKLDKEISKIINQCLAHKEDIKALSVGIICIQKISENVSKFIPLVERKLLEIVEQIRKIIGEDVIFALGKILKEDASGALVVNKISSFSSYNTEIFNELVGRHDINYIFSKLEISEKGGKKIISSELRDKLNTLYEIYLTKYKQALDQYKYEKNKWGEILQEAKYLSTQIKLPNSSWNDASKKNVITMISLICAYWTLTESVEQKQGKRDIFKMPNHTQILSVILLLGIHEDDGFVLSLKKMFSFSEKTKFQNKLIEILTGEGKSITLGFSALTLALLGCEVDIVCYSTYLSQRDEKDFCKLFQSFGVSKQIQYGTFKDQAERYLETYLDVRKATQNIIYGKNSTDLQNNSDSQNLKILLIDEVDIFFNKGYYGKTYNPVSSFKTPEITNIIQDIYRQRDQNSEIIKQAVIRSDNYKTLISQYSKFKGYIDRQIAELCLDVKQIEKHYQTHKYEVKNNQIGYKKDDSSISTSTSFGYNTLFAYFKQHSEGNIDQNTLNSKIGFSLHSGHISYALLPERYQAILGVTGTLESLNTSMKAALKKYKINSQIFSPSMFGTSKLEFRKGDMTSVETDQANQYIKIQEISASAVKKKQAVLIFFKDKQSLNDYHQSNYIVLQKERYVRVTEHHQSSDISFEVQRATRSGQIGLFVREYGRGTDFISLDPQVKEAEGVVVIQTFLSDSKTEEIQIKGRTARQGQPGKYYLILNEKDLMIFNCSLLKLINGKIINQPLLSIKILPIIEIKWKTQHLKTLKNKQKKQKIPTLRAFNIILLSEKIKLMMQSDTLTNSHEQTKLKQQ